MARDSGREKVTIVYLRAAFCRVRIMEREASSSPSSPVQWCNSVTISQPDISSTVQVYILHQARCMSKGIKAVVGNEIMTEHCANFLLHTFSQSFLSSVLTAYYYHTSTFMATLFVTGCVQEMLWADAVRSLEKRRKQKSLFRPKVFRRINNDQQFNNSVVKGPGLWLSYWKGRI